MNLHAAISTRYVASKVKCQLWPFDLKPCAVKIPAKYIPISQVICLVANEYGFGTDELKSSSRKIPLVKARHICIWLMLKYCKMSLTDVAKYLNRDHTSIMFARDKIDSYLKIYPDYRHDLTQLENRIKYKL